MQRLILLIFVFSISLSQFAVAARKANSIVDSISRGEAHLNFRYRFETVDQDSFLKNANASTIRTRLNYKTMNYKGFSLFIELDDVSYTGNEMFNSTRNGQNTYPVVADPNGADVNQFYFGYANNDMAIKFGRQRINLDNQRFVGGVGWRQNEQTFDAISVRYTGLSDMKIFYAYFNSISRIFGPEDGNPPRFLESRSHMFNGNFDFGDIGNITAYFYDFDIEDAPVLSNRTIGVRYSNKFPAGEFTIPVTVELAKQNDTGDNFNDYSADYRLLEGGINTPYVNVLFGIESLGGDSTGGSGFITPAATLHKFQGWADQFLTTPDEGIEDTYLSLSRNFSGHKISLTRHSFESEESILGLGSVDFGTELDISYSTKITDNLSVLFKYAQFKDDSLTPDDVTKIWLMLTANF